MSWKDNVYKVSQVRRKEIAETIYQQLGGGKFAVMTGAKNFVYTNTGLQFSIGKNSAGINKVIIDYNQASDLYDIEFGKVRKYEYKKIKKYTGIYADQLAKLFEENTGLYTSL